MQTLAFTLDAEALANWTPSSIGDDLEEWDPGEHGEEGSITELVEKAQRDGIINWPFSDVLEAEIQYSYSDDEDGGGYLWMLDLRRDDVPAIRLASHWEEQRHIVPSETRGRPAVLSILEEAVLVANGLLRDYTAWLGLTGTLKLVTIRHARGENYCLLTDDESAREQLYAYVNSWWDPRARNIMPTNRDEAIDAYFAYSVDDDYSIDDVEVTGPHVAARPPKPDLPAARNAIIEAGRLLETAVRTAVSSKVKAVYPTAAVLEAEGQYNEVGLLHLYTRKILDADGGVLDGQEDPSDDWDELTDKVDPMLWEISERFDEYAGTHSFDLA